MQMPSPAKLYVVVDVALSAGQQLAQAVHAAFQLSVRFPVQTEEWHEKSNFLVVLSSPDPLADAIRIKQAHVIVTEPNFDGNPVTAVAFLPHPDVGRLLSAHPLALREPAMS